MLDTISSTAVSGATGQAGMEPHGSKACET
jgi:hypothetical protein